MRVFFAAACAAGLLALPRVGLPQDPPTPAPVPVLATVGKPAPVFSLNDHTGHAVRVGGASDTWTALAFYPKAMTPG
ncbi:MAG: hypothetical protein R3F56_20325 [Planctomycetota bacterium]